jgi:hypothetical protein
VDEERDAKMRAADAEFKERQKGREADKKASLKGIEEERQRRGMEILEKAKAGAEARERERKEQETAAQEALNQLTQEAAKAREEFEKKLKPPEVGGPDMGRQSVVGTFSAAATYGMGAAKDHTKRAADGIERLVALTDQLPNKIGNQLVFG